MSPRNILMYQLKTSLQYLRDIINEFRATNLFTYTPNASSRTTSEIMMHLIRSFEYYLNGVTQSQWEFLPYNVAEYDSFEKIHHLLEERIPELYEMINKLSSDVLHTLFDHLETPTFGLNLMNELLFHHFEHCGQLTIYLRNNELTPPRYQYFI